jgi:hypothetical protein
MRAILESKVPPHKGIAMCGPHYSIMVVPSSKGLIEHKERGE